MKKFANYLLKCIAGAVISVTILSLFTLVYYNPPGSAIQPDGTTNYKHVPNKKWCYMLEGFGYGTIDNLGYNNAYYRNCQEPDIVIIGSSHLEAVHVPQDANCVYLLNKMFNSDDLPYNDFKCLNLGISGHFFNVSASNYEYVADKYKGAKYIVIEAHNVQYSPAELDKIIDSKSNSHVKELSFVNSVMRRVPYLRLLYKKIQDTVSANETNGSALNDNDDDVEIYADKMNVILNRISKASEENNIVPIILMHNRIYEDKDGNIKDAKDGMYKEAFKKCCEKNNIKVIDVVPRMLLNYEKNTELPYGFSNTVPGNGHLNKTGHKLIAEELYEQINEMEAR